MKAKLHFPYAHKNHTDAIPCGCAEDLSERLCVCECGAAYKLIDVLTFPIFTCYDCGRSRISKKTLAYLQSNKNGSEIHRQTAWSPNN